MSTKRAKFWTWKPFSSWSHILLIGIVVLALILRLVGNTHTPPSPYWEEVALGYDAYSILKTGADHQGNIFPIVAFPSFGDFKPSGYFYALVPVIAAFGLNTWSVRLPAVLASTLLTLFVYWWAKDLSGKRSIGLWSALFWAIQPWGWWLGRIGFEVNLATFFLIAGSYWLHRGLAFLPEFAKNSKRRKLLTLYAWTIPATLFLALSMYTYHGARALAPLFAALLVMWHWWQLPPQKRWATQVIWLFMSIAGLALLLTTPILLESGSPIVQQRIAETSVFSSLEPVETSNHFRELAGNTWWSRIIYHRYIFWGRQLTTNYLSHFSPSFLFGSGDSNPRHSSQFFGLLYPWEILTVLTGIGAAWITRKSRFVLLAALTLATPIAAMVTLATPHGLRAFPVAIWLAIFSGWGIHALVQWLHNQSANWPWLKAQPVWQHSRQIGFTVGVLGVCFVSTAVLAFHLWYQYPHEYAHEWQYGYEEMIQKIRTHQQQNEKLFVSRSLGRPSMYVLFYEQVDPLLTQEVSQTAEKDQRELLEFQEWSFFTGQKHADGLHAAPPELVPEEANRVDSVEDLNGKTVWVLYR
ncbi:hypothetical protein LRY58_02655 [Candidatus Woesebacteria bacterium]|nr:hypothetical protein [Candidatus Woesebacteria bacterium]MCD8545928.1 hypothetical protein [Candidatus Woesebacteria bacterium]